MKVNKHQSEPGWRVLALLFLTAGLWMSVGCTREVDDFADVANRSADVATESTFNSGETEKNDSSLSSSTEPGASTETKESTQPQDEPKAPAPLMVQVVQSDDKGDLDIYVTNQMDQDITNCIVILFEEVEFRVSTEMKPGQVAIFVVIDEIPKSVTFKSDQFSEFTFELPQEPLEFLDDSQFDWAEVETTDQNPDETDGVSTDDDDNSKP